MEHMLGMVFWVLLGSLAGSVSFAAPSYPSAIYGDDGRRDLHEVTHRPSQLAAAASVALFQRENLRRTKSGLLRVEGKTYGEEQGLCRGERFFDQPAGAFCSGVVVGPELVLTAAHCLSSARCEDLRLAFGYAKLSESHEPRELLPEDVLECREILRFKTKLDFALIRTSGRAPEEPIPLSRLGPEPKDPITLAGYPSGLPMKVVEDARVTRVREIHLNAQVDAFGGNSGSPVTRRETGELLGILVEGGEDFEEDPAAGCRRARACRGGARCGSEKILRISAILSQLGGELP